MINTGSYKQTSVGLIPIDWEVKKLGDLCSKIQDGNYGGDYPTVDEFVLTGIPFLTSKALGGEGNLIEHKIDFISIEKHLKLKKAHLKLNDILFTNRGANVGTIGIVDNRIANGNIGPQLTLLRAKGEIIYYLFLKEVMKSFVVQKQIRTQDSGSAMNFFGIGDTCKFVLPIPPFTEQQKLAAILSKWDNAIDNCKAIIEKLIGRNKGLAQQLLSGKIRVKGFEKTKWKYLAINKIAKEVSFKNSSDKELIVMSCTKYEGLVPSLEYFGRKIYSNDLTTYKIVKKGQFAYATNHIEEGSIGYQTKYDEVLISPMYTVFQTNGTLNDNLLFRILKSHQYIHEYQKRMEGSIDRRGGLRWDEFSKIKIPIFELDEQNAINKILEDANTELKQYQNKLLTLQLQKKGLVQQLLTGKIRVKYV